MCIYMYVCVYIYIYIYTYTHAWYNVFKAVADLEAAAAGVAEARSKANYDYIILYYIILYYIIVY